MYPSGRHSVFANRVAWAVIYMTRAGLVERVRHGIYRLTKEGDQLLRKSPTRVDMELLRTYPAFVEWKTPATTVGPDDDAGLAQSDEPADTPEEALHRAARELRSALETDVLDRVRNAGPAFLERVVVDLLIAMGYGGGDPAMGAALLRRRPNQSLRRRGRRQLDPSRRGEGAAEGTGGRWYLCRQRRLGVFRWYSRAWWRVSVRINAPAARGGLRTVATAAKCHRAPVDYHPVAGQMPTGLQ